MFKTFEDMYAMLWDLIYKILAIFGIERNEEGDLVEKDA